MRCWMCDYAEGEAKSVYCSSSLKKNRIFFTDPLTNKEVCSECVPQVPKKVKRIETVKWNTKGRWK